MDLSTTDVERICKEHRDFVRGVINNQFPGYCYDDDFFQEAWIGLWEALKKYDPSRGVPFKCFAAMFIKWRCFDEFERRRRYERCEAVSIDNNISETNLTYLDVLPDKENGIETLLSEMSSEELLNDIRKSGLTKRQLSIMELRAQGKTLKQIGESVGLSTSRVSDSIRVIKQTTRSLVENY